MEAALLAAILEFREAYVEAREERRREWKEWRRKTSP